MEKKDKQTAGRFIKEIKQKTMKLRRAEYQLAKQLEKCA